MNKKQAVIIVTLLALIVCAGVLASKVNNPLNALNENNTEENTVSFNNSEKETKETSNNFFLEARMTKDAQTNKTLQSLKSIIDDKNVSQEEKSKVTEEFKNVTMNAEKESKVEIALKGKGYEDVICIIEDNNKKARVIVKSKEKLTDKQSKEIHDVVMSVTKIADVEIEVKE